jgi:hypothetical protein
MPGRRLVALASLAVLLVISPAHAAEDGDDPLFRVREWSVRVAGGVDPTNIIQYYGLHGAVGFRLWSTADRWLAARNITGRWIIEPWAAYLDDSHGKRQEKAWELGVSPLFAKLTFTDATVRPFVEGGLGILYSDLRKQGMGTQMQFTSQVGAGIEYQVRSDLSLTFAARFRHMSNAGIHGGNPGLNLLYGLVGVTFR